MLHFNASTCKASCLHQFTAVLLFLKYCHYIWCKFSIMIKIYDETALSKGSIWWATSAPMYKKSPCQICTFWVQIKCIFNAYFSWTASCHLVILYLFICLFKIQSQSDSNYLLPFLPKPSQWHGKGQKIMQIWFIFQQYTESVNDKKSPDVKQGYCPISLSLSISKKWEREKKKKNSTKVDTWWFIQRTYVNLHLKNCYFI